MIKAYLVVCESCGVHRVALMREDEWIEPWPPGCFVSVVSGKLVHYHGKGETAPMLIDQTTGN